MGQHAMTTGADDLGVSSDAGVVLAPWQARYAEWLASQAEMPNPVERAKRVSRLVGRQVKPYELSRVEKMPAFRTYLLGVLSEIGREARAVVTESATRAMRAHVTAMEALEQEGDWKTLVKYTGPILERVWPKREEGEVSRAQVIINLIPNSFVGRHLQDGLSGKVEIIVAEG